MSKKTKIRTVCNLCGGRCGMLVTLENSIPIKIKGDPDSITSKGKLCIKGRASLEYLNHPDRLKYPLKRIGDRGEGKWKRTI